MNEELLEVEVANLARTAEAEIERQMYRASYKTSPNIDRISTLILIISGATISLVVSNIRNVSVIIPVESIRTLLLLLLISCLLGFLEKYYSLKLQNLDHSTEKIEKATAEIINNYIQRRVELNRDAEKAGILIEKEINVENEIDTEKILKSYAASAPRRTRMGIYDGATDGMKDPLNNYRRIFKLHARQTRTLLFQAISFLGFVIIVIYSLN